MKVLTIWQPWAWLIVAGLKDVENRSWSTRYRGPVYIHVGLTWSPERVRRALDELVAEGMLPPDKRPSLEELEAQLGHVIGYAQLIGCTPTADGSHPSRWASRAGYALEFGAVVFDVVPPVPLRGRQGLFDAPANFRESALVTGSNHKGVTS